MTLKKTDTMRLVAQLQIAQAVVEEAATSIRDEDTSARLRVASDFINDTLAAPIWP